MRREIIRIILEYSFHESDLRKGHGFQDLVRDVVGSYKVGCGERDLKKRKNILNLQHIGKS